MSPVRRINEIEPKYYADGEDAYAMKRDLVVWSKQQVTASTSILNLNPRGKALDEKLNILPLTKNGH